MAHPIQEVIVMPTKNPRVNVVLETKVYKTLSIPAKKEKVSLSTKTRELVKEAIEICEDVYWDEIAEEREKSLRKKKRTQKRSLCTVFQMGLSQELKNSEIDRTPHNLPFSRSHFSSRFASES